MPGEEGYPTYLASRMAEFVARAGLVETLDGRTGSLTVMRNLAAGGRLLRARDASLSANDWVVLHARHGSGAPSPLSRDQLVPELLPLRAGGQRPLRRSVASDWSALRQETQTLLQREASLREVAEIVGTEGLQGADRLLMHTTEAIRRNFLMQNSYTEDAFSTPQQTFERIREILRRHKTASSRLEKGDLLEAILRESA